MLHALFEVLLEAGAWFAFVAFWGLVLAAVIFAGILLVYFADCAWFRITGRYLIPLKDEETDGGRAS